VKYTVKENSNVKLVRSENYNYNFNKNTGYFERWGKLKKDDPQFAFANEILDIEITDICAGPRRSCDKTGDTGYTYKRVPCEFCYKSNTPNNKKNMSLDNFKIILDKMKVHNIINQLAFGADAQAESNPDLWAMADYARANGVIPNITVADISDEVADKLVKVMGAVAVSRYADKSVCYDSVKKLADRGLKQVNIHQLVCVETLDQVKETFRDSKTDERLKGLNAIVMLSLKKKGRGVGYNSLSQEQFKELVDLAFDSHISIGFDSCGCGKFLLSIKGRPDYKELEMLTEPCESGIFSSYIDVNGNFFPCSFAEGTENWKDGLDVIHCENFVKDIWNHPRVIEFRNTLLKCGRNCPLYNV
jgi:MoaA/NifB/PqqE/SkfB family radical SAM enzyme